MSERQIYESQFNGTRLMEIKDVERIIETQEGILVTKHDGHTTLLMEVQVWREAALEARKLVQRIYDHEVESTSPQPWPMIAEEHPWLCRSPRY